MITEFQPLPLLGEGTLWEDGDTTVNLVRPGSAAFDEIVRMRGLVACAPTSDPIDDYSTHYALYDKGKLIVWLRATRRIHGVLDCEAYYPDALIEEFKPVLVASGRLGRHPEEQGRSSLVQLAFRCGWGHQFIHGARIDILNSRQALDSFYQRIGYYALPGWSFVHPRTGVMHDLRGFVPARDVVGPWEDLFASVSPEAAFPLRQRLLSYARELVHQMQ
ncbi:hypothetical protein [Deinococcus hopiensis]|uniref:N-acetyltransferase domain-containing protein n=1 Tax=Deinococcus hopiensis KR-140 TaxID=695939 RepID=A0A1W1UAD9_9DEIO|nr:hypothetical protein [Deinococcus hopiensis]SMB77754.1 hypothetical protein SAMN00790413_03900 [Deinococcus hopiensis KR-140]